MRAKGPPKLIRTAAPTAQDEQNVELLDKVVIFAEPNPGWSSAADFDHTSTRSSVNSAVVGDGTKLGE
jgi:hypothetical protein